MNVKRLSAMRRGTATVALMVVGLLLISGCAGQTPQPSPGEHPTPTSAIPPTPSPSPPPSPTPEPTPTPAFPVWASTPYPPPSEPLGPENVDQAALLARWGKGRIQEIAWSPQGDLLAVVSPLGCFLYDAETLEEVRFLTGSPFEEAILGPFVSVAFSPDGRQVAVGQTFAPYTLIWDVETGEMASVVPDSAFSLAFSPDGRLLAMGQEFNPEVRVWDVEAQEVTVLSSGVVDSTGDVKSVAFSPDGRLLAAGMSDGTVAVWDVATRALLFTRAHTDLVTGVAFSPDGRFLASGSWDSTVQIWDPETGALRRTLSLDDWAWSVAFAPDGRLFVGKFEGTVEVWDPETGQRLATLQHEPEGHINKVHSLAVSPDGQRLASSTEGSLQIWDTATGERLHTLEGHVSPIAAMDLSADGRTLALGTAADTVLVWDAADGTPLHTLRGLTHDAEAVAISPDGQLVAASSEGGDLLLWDVETEEVLYVLKPAEEWALNVVDGLAFSPDGETLVSLASLDRQVKFWDPQTGGLVRTLEAPDEAMALALSPDGRLLAVGDSYGNVVVWDLEADKRLYTLPLDEETHQSVYNLSFSPDGQLLAANVGVDVKMVDVGTGETLYTLEMEGYPPVTFSPDGQLLLVPTGEGLEIWATETGEPLVTLEPALVEWSGAEFSPDGRAVFLSAWDGVVRVFGLPPRGD
ncbi:MAG TPA: hypothetical protein ENK08_00240 [Chloroflexi bacterium]|nr:hypothetical protein [Chloroflexota bacterium]